MTYLVPDALPAIRKFFRTSPYTAPLVGGRVFFTIPKTEAPKSPFMRLYRSGGTLQANSEAPIATIRVAIEAWATKPSEYTTVRNLVRGIETACQTFPAGLRLTPNTTFSTRVLNIVITTAVDMPDPETNWPRVVLDSIWTVSN